MLAAILALLLPAFPAQSEELDRPVNLWPLYYRRTLPDGYESEALFWLYARRRQGAESDTRVRPLFRHERTQERLKSRLFPLYDYRRGGGKTDLGLLGLSPFTLAAFSHDDASGSVSRRALIWSYERGGGRSDLELPPFWMDARGAAGERRVAVLGLPEAINLYERREIPARGLVERHLLTYWTLRSPDDSYTHLWPFYGVRRTGTRLERSTLWPLAARTADAKTGLRQTRFWPLFIAHSDPSDSDEPPAMALHMALPIPLWYHSTTKDSVYRRILYLHWDARGQGWRKTVTPPWYSLSDERAGTLHHGLFPFYHGSRWGGRSLDLAPPLFFSWRDDDLRVSILFPLYFARHDAAGGVDYFFPFYGRTLSGGKVTRRFLLFPLYARRSEPGLKELDLVWPLVHVSRSSEAASTRLLPLYWSSRRGEDSFTLAPLYARLSRGPETRAVLFPLYWRLAAPGADARYLPPLGGLVRSAGASDFFALGFTPTLSLFERERDDGTGLSLDRALLYYRRREGPESADALVPLFWRWENPGERGLVLFPLYASSHQLETGARRRCALGLCGGFSLIESYDEPSRNAQSLRVLLYYRSTRGTDKATVLAPLYWRFASEASARTWLFPLYASRRTPESRATGLLGVSPRWSLWSRSEESGAVETRLLWRLVRVRRAPGDSAVEFNPLFFTMTEGNTRYSAVLGGLVGWETSPAGRKWRWLWVF